jgi:hypothetical protein
MACRLCVCAARTSNYLVLVGIVRIRRPPIPAQTAKEIVDQNQEAALGTEKIRVNKDLAHMPAPVFRPIGQRHSLQRDHREKMAAGGIPAQPSHAAKRPAFLTMLLVRRASSCAAGKTGSASPAILPSQCSPQQAGTCGRSRHVGYGRAVGDVDPPDLEL